MIQRKIRKKKKKEKEDTGEKVRQKEGERWGGRNIPKHNKLSVMSNTGEPPRVKRNLKSNKPT